MTYDFLIVGAGIVGASVAHELARSARVCVIEGEARGGLHATGRSAALYDPAYGGAQFRVITRASRTFFTAPPEGFSEQALVRPRGCLYIARADQAGRLRERLDGGASAVPISSISEADALSLVPLLRRSYVAAAAWCPHTMDIDVDALHQGFLRGARAGGARVVTNARLAGASRAHGVWSVDTPEGVLRAPVIVNAAGAWADEVASAVGARALGLRPLRRTALLIEPPPGVDVRRWPAVMDVDERFYFKPDAGRLLLSPADETPDRPRDAYPDDLDVAIAVDRVQAALDIEIDRVSHSWAGLRTFAPDRAPVVGFDPTIEGLFWCAGQGGYGVQSAPAMGRLAAALAQQGSVPADLAAEGLSSAAVSPARFGASAPA